ncbi:beta-phosphoglucomutase [Vagococcus fluvialis]|uniref:beta-phosphoglucomutase n=1 Tax=Vagococcus fluvialis TaxID=2738 RepID=UPI003D100A4A
MIRGALFDLDGVIADTSIFHFKAWQQLIQKNYGLELPSQLEEQTKGISRRDSLTVIVDYLNISVSDEQFNEILFEKNELYKSYLEDISDENILPGIKTFIAELKAADIKISLASASQNGPFILEKLHLLDFFDSIIDPSTLKRGKPAPDIFNAAAASLNLKPLDCIGIEDSIAGINAINESGAFSVAIGDSERLEKANLIFTSTEKLNLAVVEQAFYKF